jgi:hypothetical protein
MSYEAQAALTNDSTFIGRSNAAAAQQSEIFKDDQRPDYVALAGSVMRGQNEELAALCRLAAAGPGIADKADLGDGTIDQALVTDADLLALTQANWPTAAALYYAPDGTPL